MEAAASKERMKERTRPAYSTYGASGGGFVVGCAREPDGDIYLPDEVSAHVWISPNGLDWTMTRSYHRLSVTENVRADVSYELPSGLLVLQLENAQGCGSGGVGYQCLRVNQSSATP